VKPGQDDLEYSGFLCTGGSRDTPAGPIVPKTGTSCLNRFLDRHTKWIVIKGLRMAIHMQANGAGNPTWLLRLTQRFWPSGSEVEHPVVHWKGQAMRNAIRTVWRLATVALLCFAPCANAQFVVPTLDAPASLGVLALVVKVPLPEPSAAATLATELLSAAALIFLFRRHATRGGR
jgi:hypothetical protein